MILKFYEINKINISKNNLFLFYGKNESLKNEAIKQISKNELKPINYEEKEILDQSDEFIESILNKSLFENEKVIIIKRATDKIIKILEQIKIKKID
ncbi:MAG: DNA polymerase III subunit delta, partial [Candidatus Pelagibacter sp.]